ncbi:MAG: prolyl oligopeptidase family serine peptidase [Clostridia bacterium]|nr:prolyl oligopeptidase family serine peptidase [Clostridia bacterium]
MPIVDMPLEELKKYQGISPKPKDIDEYWDKGLEQMRNVKANAELKPAQFVSPVADCFNLYFTGVGGARVHAKLLMPKNPQGKKPAIIEFHGYTGASGDWADKLAYVAMGYTVASLDCRGQGGLSRDNSATGVNTVHGHIIRGVDDGAEHLLYRSIYLDTAQLAYLVMDFDWVDETRVGCKGQSQGGGLTLACASLVPEIKLAMSQFPFLSDYKRVWEMDLGGYAYRELSDYFRFVDPTHEREDEFFGTLAYIDVQNMVHRANAQVLMITGLMDVICPPSAQFAAYNKITSKKDMVIYPDYGHEQYPGQRDIAYEFLAKL